MAAKKFIGTLSAILALVMCIGVLPVSSLAYDNDYVSETHRVFSHQEHTLAPGIEQYTNYAYSNDGKQMVYYVATADISRDDVVAQTAYKGMQHDTYGMDKLSNIVASANAKYSDYENPEFISEYYSVVAGVNGSGYNMTTGQPSGAWAMGGTVIQKPSGIGFFAIRENKTAVIGKNIDDWNRFNSESPIVEAISAFAGNQGILVWEGKDVTANTSGSYNVDRHSRTMLGITKDGKVVMAVLDGRQEPFSCGGSMHELAQIMLEAGCYYAINLDGGGSTTFVARQEGDDNVSIINRPSDGSERSISNGFIFASTTPRSDTFDHAKLTVEDEYITPGTSTSVTAIGVSPAGSKASIPENAVIEATLGTVSDGVFTSDGTEGDAVISMKVGSKTVGSVTVHVVVPDKITFGQEVITVPFGKTVPLPIKATYGLNEVKTKPEDFIFELLLESGTVSDGMLTAPEEDEIYMTYDYLYATLVFNEEISTYAEIDYGRGSLVLCDFENGTVNGFYRQSKTGYNYINTPGTAEIATAADGKVHSGDKSLRVTMDFSVSPESGYHSAMLGYYGGTIDLKNVTNIGMWMYVPKEVTGLNGRIFLCKVTDRDEKGNITGYEGYYTDNTIDGDSKWDVGFTTSYEESGWHYISFDINTGDDWCIFPGATFLDIYVSDRDNSNYNYDHLKEKSIYQNVALYIDDISVDFSDACDDRQPPVFSGIYYADESMNDAALLENGTVETRSTVSFTARVAEDTRKSNYSGIDTSTAKAYIDGNEVKSRFVNGMIFIDDIALADGVHSIKFSVCDNEGNYASIIRKIEIAASSGIPSAKLVPHDPEADRILLGSLWYADLVVDDIKNLNTMSVELDLNNMSEWGFYDTYYEEYLDIDGIIDVAEGFDVKCSVLDPFEKTIRLDITRIGTVTESGEAAVVSIPIRTWELPVYVCDSTDHVGEIWMYPQYKARNDVEPIDINVRVAKGLAVFATGEKTFFSGDEIGVDTESYVWSNGDKPAEYASWNGGHDHRDYTEEYYEEGTTNHTDVIYLDDAEPTCSKCGYYGRTYCEVCSSIVDWGVIEPALGHSYKDGICTRCGLKFTGEKDGLYYVEGEIADGWVGTSYYIDGVKVTGIHEADGLYCDFGENGVSLGVYTGVFFDEENGVYRYSQFGELTSGWKEIDGDWYYFYPSTLAAKAGPFNNGTVTYELEETGKVTHGIWNTDETGTRYYYGPNYYRHGWYNIDGKDYYFGDATQSKGYIYKGLKYVIASNSRTPEWYDFGEDGAAEPIYNTGLLTTEDGLYYLINGVSQTGLQLVDGKYYYFSGTYEARSGVVSVSDNKNNGLLPAGYYLFGEDYAMVDGKFADWNGVENYIVLGQRCYAGLIETEEGIMYVGNDYKKRTGLVNVKEDKTNGILEAGYYRFGDDGILADNEISQWNANATLYYMKDGKPFAAGLVKLDGKYYYAASGGAIVIGKSYKITNTNGLLPAATYTFDENGVLQLDHNITGHLSGEWEITLTPTCTKEGLKQHRCELCGEFYESSVIPANGHTFSSEFTTDLEPTETACGYKSRHCLFCNEKTDITEIAPLVVIIPGDINGDGEVTTRDSRLLKMYIAGTAKEEDIVYLNADVNGDGEYGDSKDSRALKKLIVS